MAKQHIKREAGQRYEFKKKQCKGLRFTLFQMYLKLNVQKCMQYIKMFGTIVHIEFFIWHHVCGFIIFILLPHYCKQPSIPVHATRRSRPMPDSRKAKCSPNKSLWGSLKAFHGQ